MNYEVISIRVPADQRTAEVIERELERIATAGGELITILPTTQSDVVLGIFRSMARDSLRQFKSA